MWLCSLVILIIINVSSGEVIRCPIYKFLQTLHHDKGLHSISYQIRGTALIQSVNDEFLTIKLSDLKLFKSSNKFPSDTYEETKTVFEQTNNHPFYIHRKDGKIEKLYFSKSEDPHIMDIKRSLSSLLQFQRKSCDKVETDVSGKCKVQYAATSSLIKKTKLECQSSLPGLSKSIWGGWVNPLRITEINIEGDQFKTIKSKEEYNIQLSIADFVETTVSTEISLERESYQDCQPLKDGSIETIISEAGKTFETEYAAFDLSPDDSERPSYKIIQELSAVVKENLKFLKSKNLGTINSALSALKVMKAVKQTSHNDIYEVLKSKSNKKIIGQLLDILGGIQTPESHKAAMKFLNINSKEYDLDLCERYLWALSTSTYHKKAIIMDLLSLTRNGIEDKKLLETLMQTISSMVKKSAGEFKDLEFFDKAVNLIKEKLKNCNKTDELCQRIYLKAFTNIRSPKVLSLLIEYVLTGSKSIGVRAMKAIQALGKDHWNEEVIKVAERVYLSNGTYDSSSKVIALDILLDSNKYSYSKLVHLIKHRHASPELKEYLLQRLFQVSEKDREISQLIKSTLLKEGLYHYNTFAQGGLSTAFNRNFMRNGFLSTAQEIKSGLLKQGYVHINVEDDGDPKTIFTLGLFSNGLSSFVSDDESDEEENVETTAGLELTVLGVEFRPFIFFEGHGQLMGHVFSGAGSTLTPAYQAILLLKDEVAYIPLATGVLMSIRFLTIASVDLSGKIEISIWSRTAESLVQNSAGLVVEEIIKIHTPYLDTETNIKLTAEPQLKLSSDIQFSSKVALCLQLEQPDSAVQYNTSTVISAIGEPYKSEKFVKLAIPGKSYALNSKNNEMCNALYSQ